MAKYGYGYQPFQTPALPVAEEAALPFGVSDVFVNGLGLIQIDLTKPVFLTEAVLNSSNYAVSPGVTVMSVLTLLDESARSAESLYLKVSRMSRGADFTVTIQGNVLRSVDGEYLAAYSGEFVSKQSKFELLRSKFPSNAFVDLETDDLLTHVLAAMALEDDAIGGGASRTP